MNVATIQKLVWKDWHLNRLAISLMLGGTVVGTALTLLPGRSTTGIGISLVLAVFIALTFYLPLTTVLEERTQKTLPFIMSLPVSPSEYAAAKLSANLLLFLVPWTVGLVGASLVASSTGDGVVASGFVSTGFFPAAMGGMVVLFAFIVCFAIITESTGWTVAAIVGLMFLVGNVATLLVPRLPGAPEYFKEVASRGAALYWTLGIEVIAVACLVALTFYQQVRKQDFL